MIVSAAVTLNETQLRIWLFAEAFTLRAPAPPLRTPESVTDDEVTRLVAAVSGNAQRGAGKTASGPATKADNSNFRIEKL